MTEYLKPGDIVLTRGRSLVSRLIRLCTRRVGESRTRVNHVAVVVDRGVLGHDLFVTDPPIVEALSRVYEHGLIDRYGGGRDEIAVYRCRPLTEVQRLAVAAAARNYVGRGYGYFKIALHLLDWLLQGAYVFRRLGRMDRYPICSWLVAHAYWHGAWRDFGVEPGAATPDDIWDCVTSRPDGYECIRPLGPLHESR